MIIDAHAHLSDTSYGNAELYLNRLKQAGIALGVVVPGGMLDVRKMTDYVIGLAKPENPAPDNAYTAGACLARPGELARLICLNPHDPDAARAFEDGVAHGCRGLKLSPITHEFTFAGKAVAALAALCGDYGLPLYAHVLYNPGASTARFAVLARQFPRTNFILGHMGFGPADREAVEAAMELDNLFLETSTANSLHLEEAARKAGPGKIVFGTEFPLSHPAVELKKIMLLDLSDDDRERILGGNIRLLTGI